MHLRSWTKHDISLGTRVFLRIDGNVPVVKGVAHDGEHGRLAETIPEIIKLRAHGARIIIATHLGDPKGKVDQKFSTIPVARLLQKKLGQPIQMIPRLHGKEVERVILGLKPGEVAMLENLRFDSGEEKNEAMFARSLAKLADIYVNNAFGVCHRKHASVVAITKYLPSFAGSLLIKEVSELSRKPTHPFVLMMGGAKLSTKLPILKRLGEEADKILLGGAIAIPFLKALDRPLCVEPKGLVDQTDVRAAAIILRKYMEKIILPEDLVIDETGQRILDLGPRSIKLFHKSLKGAKFILWNGPFGIIEDKDGRQSTIALAQTIAKLKPAHAILGGGDSVTFLENKDLLGGFTHVSTGGGAMLAFLAGETLPGLEVLEMK